MAGREDQLFSILTLVIGAVVGTAMVAFILLTERFGARLHPEGGAAWRRVLIPPARWEWGICSSDIFRMREEAECR